MIAGAFGRVFAVAILAGLGVQAATLTFHRDVEPVLQARCQTCHRPGEAAPMSLLTYKQTRPWSKAIKTAVLTKKMPPWFAEAGIGQFHNDRSLSQNEIDTLVGWVDAGAPEGSLKDAPPPSQFVEGWGIGQPDAVFEMPAAFEIPAAGVVDYQWVVIPLHFTEDRWIRAIEVRPGNRSVVHHIAAFHRRPGSKWLADVQPGVMVPKAPGVSEGGMADGIIGEYVPGLPAKPFPDESAMLVPAGSDVVLQVHYTPNGKATSDRSKFGLIFAKQPPKQRFFYLGVASTKFVIPANDPSVRVDSQMTFGSEVRLLDLQPHMHLRGKSFEFRATYPDGREELLLRVPHYDFNWQITYELEGEKVLPAGTRISATAVFDNSANNPSNPNPNVEVRNGDQSTDEMMAGVIHIAVPPDVDLRKIFRPLPKY